VERLKKEKRVRREERKRESDMRSLQKLVH
jgi:hypothetical protein